MVGFVEAKQARDQVYDTDVPKAKLSAELLGSAAAFESLRVWEQNTRKDGKPVKHNVAKDLLATAVGIEVDRLSDAKGLDVLEKEKAKHYAKKQVGELYDQQYGGRDQFNPDYEGPEQFGHY